MRFFTDRYYFKLVIFRLETDNLQNAFVFLGFLRESKDILNGFLKWWLAYLHLKKEFFIISREKIIV